MIDAARTLVIVLAATLASGGTLLTIGLLGPGTVDGTGADFGLDTNGNGRFDWLVVDASVDLPESGVWDVSGSLFGNGTPVSGPCATGFARPAAESFSAWPITSVYERYFFTAGPQTVRLAFTGTDIERAGLDGPYGVQAIFSLGGYVAYVDSGILPPDREAPYVQWNYTTRSYDASEFEEPVRPVAFTGSHEDAGIHVDGDGLYDLLGLSAGVRVTTPGTYGLSGVLSSRADPNETHWAMPVAYAYRDVRLEVADTSVTIHFRGDQIRMSGVNGPWDFSLTLYPSYPYPYDGRNGTVPGTTMHPIAIYPEVLCGTTGPYSAGDFDDSAELVRYTGAFEEAPADWDADGRYEALVVRAEVESFVNGGFDFDGTLRSADGTRDIARFAAQGYLPIGVSWTEWAFPGGSIAASGIDGPYEAVLSLTPSPVGIDPTTTYVTRSYRAADFEGDATGRPSHWISALNATGTGGALRVYADVQRGDDMLTYVIEDVLTLVVYADARNEVFKASDRVYLPSGGSSQSFAYSVDGLSPGTYTVVATLGNPDAPLDVWSVTVSL